MAGRIERERVGPHQPQPVANAFIAQILEIDAEALAVGELGVVLPLAGEVGIELQAMADIAGEDERRPAVRSWQAARIAFGRPPAFIISTSQARPALRRPRVFVSAFAASFAAPMPGSPG